MRISTFPENYEHMRSVVYLSAAALTLFIAGCTNKSSATGDDRAVKIVQTDTTLLPPLEKNPPNTNYNPAFPGQTRINAVKTTTPYQVDQLAEDLGRPWAIILLPDE